MFLPRGYSPSRRSFGDLGCSAPCRFLDAPAPLEEILISGKTWSFYLDSWNTWKMRLRYSRSSYTPSEAEADSLESTLIVWNIWNIWTSVQLNSKFIFNAFKTFKLQCSWMDTIWPWNPGQAWSSLEGVAIGRKGCCSQSRWKCFVNTHFFSHKFGLVTAESSSTWVRD